MKKHNSPASQSTSGNGNRPFARLAPKVRQALRDVSITTADDFARLNEEQLFRIPGLSPMEVVETMDAAAREWFYLLHGRTESDIPSEKYEKPLSTQRRITPGVRQALEAAGIRTVGQLAEQQTAVLAGLPGIGPARLQRLLHVLGYWEGLTTRLKK